MNFKIFTSILVLFVTLSFFINTASAQWYNLGISLNPLRTSYFINNQTGYVAGENSAFFKTTNGGNNWTALSGINDDVHAIYFSNENTGIRAGSIVRRTTDGGASWLGVTYDVPYEYIRGMTFINSDTGWLCGSNGKIFKTVNGGAHLSLQNSGTTDYLQSIFFIDENSGWACGSNGTILRTTNGGINWITDITTTFQSLRSISFSSSQNGLVCGANGTILRTTNGGINWTWSSPSVQLYYGVYCYPGTSLAWAVGSFTGTYCTTNGGTNWSLQTNGIYYCSSVKYFGDYFGCITDLAGNITITNTGGFNLIIPTLTLTPTTTSQITLSWANPPDADKTMIERSTDGSNWTLIDSVGENVNTYQSSGLAYNTDYYFRVRARKLFFTGGYSNEPRGRAQLNTPANLSPVNDTLYINTSVTPTFTWSSVSGAFGYDCQIATDTAFTNIVYSNTGIPGTSQVIPPGILQNSNRYFWRTRSVNIITYSTYSSFWKFTVQDPNYGHNMQTSNNLYYFANSTSGADLSPSKPTYNWRDTTGSTELVLNRTSIAPLAAGNLNNGRFDLISQLPVGNSIRFFGTNYQNVYIGTNGIVGFNAFTPTGTDFVEPTSSLPQANITNAIFPLWYNTNFQDSDVPVNRLCYKVTSNELIITFSRVPSNNADANDYVSFQVIISHSASPVANSAITIQYNYDQTGSTFISRYNANTLTSHMVGIQGLSSNDQCYQYRYLNSSSQLATTGPMFGSNLALQFGPNATLLPIELLSFTSQVNGSNVKLDWSTISEQNNSGFDIERKSVEEVNWKKITFLQGNGTTNESKNYSYEDKNLPSGKYRYRLKQIDFNGNFEYHTLANEVEIGVPKKFNLSQNYPNPFNPATKINFELPRSSDVKLSVYDITGKLASELVNEQRAAGYYTVEFNGSNLSSGMYFYRIQAGEFIATKKMMLVK